MVKMHDFAFVLPCLRVFVILFDSDYFASEYVGRTIHGPTGPIPKL